MTTSIYPACEALLQTAQEMVLASGEIYEDSEMIESDLRLYAERIYTAVFEILNHRPDGAPIRPILPRRVPR
jgi:hypothetical protein